MGGGVSLPPVASIKLNKNKTITVKMLKEKGNNNCPQIQESKQKKSAKLARITANSFLGIIFSMVKKENTYKSCIKTSKNMVVP